MPLTPVQNKTAVTVAAAASLTATWTSTPTQGNLLLAFANSDGLLTMNSSGWTLALAEVVQFTALDHWWKIAGAAESTTVQVSPSASTSVALFVMEFSGNSASPLDKTASNNPGSNAASIASGTTAATTQADETAFAAVGWNEAGGFVVTATSWTNSFVEEADLRGVAGASVGLAVASLVTVATGAQTTTATLSNTGGRPIGLIATYMAAAPAQIPPLTMAPYRG